jgi:transcriptional regulator with XRE-family HTH domain
MRGVVTSSEEISKIKSLRSKGLSISQISESTKKSKSIVSKYIKGVKISSKNKEILLARRNWSKDKSLIEWSDARLKSQELIRNISNKDNLLILACLYWGEGTKRELNIINSDPDMLRVIISCLKELGIENSKIKATLRVYCDINHKEAIQFWSTALNLPVSCFKNVNVLVGKKSGKLPYGMCRIRVEKSSKYFKLIMSLIERIKTLSS